MSKHISYMDIAKALGIILVVIGHADSKFSNIIFLFHMPLFFFISGYFYNDKYSYNPKPLILKRLKTLYLPFVTFELIYLFLHNFFININIYSSKIDGHNVINHIYSKTEIIKLAIKNITFGGTEQLAGAFWFFLSLFCTTILFSILSFVIYKLFRKNTEIIRAITIFIIFIIGNILPANNIELPRKFNIVLVAIFIYYLGFLYAKYEYKLKDNLIIFTTCVIGLLFNNSHGSINMANTQYTNPIFFISSSLFGIYIILYISKKCDKYNMKLLRYIGKSTVSVMILHFLCFKIVNEIQILIYNYPQYMLAKFPVISGKDGWWIIYSVVGVILPVYLCYLYRNIKLLSIQKLKSIHHKLVQTR